MEQHILYFSVLRDNNVLNTCNYARVLLSLFLHLVNDKL